jgi:transcriptional regulator with XRE-family HTH domain
MRAPDSRDRAHVDLVLTCAILRGAMPLVNSGRSLSGMAANEGQPVRQRVGPTVRTVREERGLTLEALASRVCISASHLSRIERGLTMPSSAVLVRVTDALAVDIGILTDEERSTRAVDAILDRLPLSAPARVDLLRLTPATRAELAGVLAHCENVATIRAGMTPRS